MKTHFGHILKTRRKEMKLTLNQLSQKTGLSSAYLSLLERDLNNPTVESLNRICTVLELTLADLIEKAAAPTDVVIRSDQRKVIFQNDGYLYEAASDGQRKLACLVLTISDTTLHESDAHVTDEIGFVLSGSALLNIGCSEYALSTGDCIYIEAGQKHCYKKTSEENCVIVWFCESSHDHVRIISGSVHGSDVSAHIQ